MRRSSQSSTASSRVQRPGIEAPWHYAVRDREDGQQGLGDSRSAERVAGPAFGRAARGRRSEDGRHGLILSRIVASRRCPVQIDVVDRLARDCPPRQGLAHRPRRPFPLRMRSRDVVSIAALTIADQCYARAAGHQQRESRSLADTDAAAVSIPGPAGLGRQELQGIKAIEDRQTKAVHPSNQGGVA